MEEKNEKEKASLASLMIVAFRYKSLGINVTNIINDLLFSLFGFFEWTDHLYCDMLI